MMKNKMITALTIIITLVLTLTIIPVPSAVAQSSQEKCEIADLNPNATATTADYLKQGDTYYGAQRYAEAETCYREAITVEEPTAITPEFLSAKYLLIETLFQQGKIDQRKKDELQEQIATTLREFNNVKILQCQCCNQQARLRGYMVGSRCIGVISCGRC